MVFLRFFYVVLFVLFLAIADREARYGYFFLHELGTILLKKARL